MYDFTPLPKVGMGGGGERDIKEVSWKGGWDEWEAIRGLGKRLSRNTAQKSLRKPTGEEQYT